MRAAKVDRNQREIVGALRDAGASVQLLHAVGQGCPDLLVGIRGRNLLVEVKAPDAPKKNGGLNDRQVDWHASWRGQVAVVTSADEALKAIGVTSYADLRRQIIGDAE